MVLLNFDLQWQTIWYYTENYGALIYDGKTMVLSKKNYENDLLSKKIRYNT